MTNTLRPGLAVKALIIKDNHLLLIKRNSSDIHQPNEWDIPGGWLDEGEDPYLGLQKRRPA